jgi:fused signal recognition particle receptor
MLKKTIALSALFLLLVIAIGAFVQLVGAGVGCADWPDCYGQIMLQPDEHGLIRAVANFDEHPLRQAAVWGLRVAAVLLILSVLALAPMLWRLPQRSAALRWWAMAVFLLLSEGYLGAQYAQIKLAPALFTGHVLLAFMLFAWLAWGYWRWDSRYSPRPQRVGPVVLAWIGLIVSFSVIKSGAWVDSHFAALACSDFPRCEGHWLPEKGFVQLFNVLAAQFGHDAQVAAHWLHRAGGLVCFIVLSILMLSATNERNPKMVKRCGSLLSVVLLIEIGLGIALIKHSLPILPAVLHQVFAALLLLPLLGIIFFAFYRSDAEEEPHALEQTSDQEADLGIATADTGSQSSVSLYGRLKQQLAKTRGGLGGVFQALAAGASDTELWQEIETRLIMADVGIETTTAIIDRLKSSLSREQLSDPAALKAALKAQLLAMLQPYAQPLHIPNETKPYVILVVGVNGAGKTTSIGKLAHRLLGDGKRLMLAAGDTFRAAAVEQLQTWGERNQVPVVAQHTGADSASVIFDAVQSAQSKQVDVLIADTAGRLHTKSNLMEELKKIKRIIAKLDEQAPHEVLLVLDAGTGQNALSQARLFNEAVSLTGIALTKLDGTAKGGVIFALANQMRLPIRFIGVGEGMDDLQDFDAHAFIEALFSDD